VTILSDLFMVACGICNDSRVIRRQPTFAILYDGATHHARPPANAASKHMALPSRVLPHRRPHASTLNRAGCKRAICCPG
jgi:hypothetical protein